MPENTVENTVGALPFSRSSVYWVLYALLFGIGMGCIHRIPYVLKFTDKLADWKYWWAWHILVTTIAFTLFTSL